MPRLVSQPTLPDWLQPHLRWVTIPSWVMSLGLHGVMVAVLLVVARLPGCQADIAGEEGEAFREVGLYLRPTAVSEPSPPEQEPREQPAAALPAAAPAPVPTQPPVPLQLPALSAAPVIGAGGLPRTATGMERLLAASGSGPAAPPAASGGGTGATNFLGVEDQGRRFVYLIDSSSSMADYGAFRVAKMELLASLERLNETQQFQVIFCNSETALKLDAGRFGMFFGTDSQRLEVRLQIAGIHTDAGTNHEKGLLAALDFNPDVIFFLSDAGEPYLTAKQLDAIKRRNRGGARIHCIEFGRGPLLLTNGQPPPNFLTKLAAQNDGRYVYQDVTQFTAR
jgi:hypothetical protein